jgi:hypothetical protein
LDRAEQVNKRAAKPINSPGHYNVKTALAGVLKHLIQPRTIIAPLCPANACVAVFPNNFPARALGNLPQLANLFSTVCLSVDTRT